MNRLYWLGRWSNGEFEALFKINSDLSFIWRHNMFFFHVRIPYFILERGWWGVVQQWWWGFCLVPIRFWVGDTYFMFCALCVCVSVPRRVESHTESLGSLLPPSLHDYCLHHLHGLLQQQLAGSFISRQLDTSQKKRDPKREYKEYRRLYMNDYTVNTL